MSRYARKVDASHKAVVGAFRAMGCTVEAIQGAKAGLPDLVVGFAARTHLVEVKPNTLLKAHQPSAAQDRFAMAWRGGGVPVVRTVDDAAALVLSWRNTQLLEHQAAQALARERAA
jgi:hypothetical protein